MKKYVELQCDDLTMRGYLQGEGDSVIVMFHGFTGHKTESNGLFRYVADGLETQNIPTLRFDWFGHGESDLHFEEITVPLLRKQGKIIIDYALEHFKTVYLLGFSMGGGFAMDLVTNDIKKLILMAPAAFLTGLHNEFFKDNDLEFVDLSGHYLARSFSSGFKDLNALENAKKFNGPILILQGEDDAAVPLKSTVYVKNNLPNSKMHVFGQADHCFHKRMYHDQIIDVITEFINE